MKTPPLWSIIRPPACYELLGDDCRHGDRLAQVEAGHLFAVANEQLAAGNHGMIPGLASERMDLAALDKIFRRGLGENDLARFFGSCQTPGAGNETTNDPVFYSPRQV
jgi:hypothetical protein